MPTCAFIESPEGMESGGALWDQFAKGVQAVRPDILVMNEMPPRGAAESMLSDCPALTTR
jgi:hypothetical protein